MHVLVIGAGVIGVSTAWRLRQAGCDVTLIDKEPACGLKTSFANGGQISVSHAEPWAQPGMIRKIYQWLGQHDAPMLFKLRANPAQLLWALRFIWECRAQRALQNTRHLLALGLYSRQQLQILRQEIHLEYHALTRGILHIYTEKSAFESACQRAEFMQTLGCARKIKTPSEIVQIEPALSSIESALIGGTYTAEDESGDAFLFTQNLLRYAQDAGIEFQPNTELIRFEHKNNRIQHVITNTPDGEKIHHADAFVITAGCSSTLLAQQLHISIPVYPLKGYSITIPLFSDNDDTAPFVSITDEAQKIVFTRLGNKLRVAGTAELDNYDESINQYRCQLLIDRTKILFPNCGPFEQASPWCGLRPATPSNIPIIDRAPSHRNLFFNTGHGSLGWTHACGSAQLLADLICQKTPAIDPTPYTFSASNWN